MPSGCSAERQTSRAQNVHACTAHMHTNAKAAKAGKTDTGFNTPANRTSSAPPECIACLENMSLKKAAPVSLHLGSHSTTNRHHAGALSQGLTIATPVSKGWSGVCAQA
jgi:hypothetical protein